MLQLAKAVSDPSAKNWTVPLAKGVVGTASLTVAVQLVGVFTGTLGGLQLTVVPLECFAVTVTAVVPELPKCVESPP